MKTQDILAGVHLDMSFFKDQHLSKKLWDWSFYLCLVGLLGNLVFTRLRQHLVAGDCRGMLLVPPLGLIRVHYDDKNNPIIKLIRVIYTKDPRDKVKAAARVNGQPTRRVRATKPPSRLNFKEPKLPKK